MSVMTLKIPNDGARNAVLEVNLLLDSEKGIAPTVVLDPSKLYVDPHTPTSKLRIDYINYVLHSGMEVDLWWETDGEHELIRHLEGRGMVDVENHGGIHNTAPGKTGSIMLSATGWTEGKPLKGSLTIEAVKQ